jgi:hypothetical protein
MDTNEAVQVKAGDIGGHFTGTFLIQRDDLQKLAGWIKTIRKEIKALGKAMPKSALASFAPTTTPASDGTKKRSGDPVQHPTTSARRDLKQSKLASPQPLTATLNVYHSHPYLRPNTTTAAVPEAYQCARNPCQNEQFREKHSQGPI